MPFAFSQLRPRTQDTVPAPEIEIGEFLSTSFMQGFNDSALMSLSRMTELSMISDGTLLSADEATSKYGLKTEDKDFLKFDAPVYENVAREMRRRKEAELRRNFVLSQGSKGLVSGRGIAGLGAMMLGNISNPLDFAANFIPVVGSEKAVVGLGQSLVRSAAKPYRGLVTREALGRMTRFPHVAESFIEGVAGAAITEIPLFMSNSMDKADYGIDDATINILGGGVFNTVINAAVRGAFRILQKTGVSTRESMARTAMEQAITDEDISVHRQAEADDAVINDTVKLRKRADLVAKARALDPTSVNKGVLERIGARAKSIVPVLDFGNVEFTTKAGGSVSQTKTEKVRFVGRPGESLAQTRGRALRSTSDPRSTAAFLPKDVSKATGVLEVHDSQGNVIRTITEDQIPEVMGMEAPYFPKTLVSDEEVKQLVKSDQDARRRFVEARRNGASIEQGLDEVRGMIRAKNEQAFFDRPDVKREVEQEKAARLKQLADEELAKESKKKAEQEAAIEEGHTIDEETREAFTLEDESYLQTLKEQTAALMDDVTADLKQNVDELGKVIDELEDLAKNPDTTPRKIDEAAEAAEAALKEASIKEAELQESFFKAEFSDKVDPDFIEPSPQQRVLETLNRRAQISAEVLANDKELLDDIVLGMKKKLELEGELRVAESKVKEQEATRPEVSKILLKEKDALIDQIKEIEEMLASNDKKLKKRVDGAIKRLKTNVDLIAKSLPEDESVKLKKGVDQAVNCLLNNG